MVCHSWCGVMIPLLLPYMAHHLHSCLMRISSSLSSSLVLTSGVWRGKGGGQVAPSMVDLLDQVGSIDHQLVREACEERWSWRSIQHCFADLSHFLNLLDGVVISYNTIALHCFTKRKITNLLDWYQKKHGGYLVVNVVTAVVVVAVVAAVVLHSLPKRGHHLQHQRNQIPPLCYFQYDGDCCDGASAVPLRAFHGVSFFFFLK